MCRQDQALSSLSQNMVYMAAAFVGFVTLALSTAASLDQNVQRLFDMLDTDGDGVFSPLELNEHFAGGNASFRSLKGVFGELDKTGDSKFTVEDLHLLADFDRPHKIEQVKVALTGIPTEMKVMFVIMGKSESNVTVEVKKQQSNGTFTWEAYPTSFNTYSVPSRWWEPNGWDGYVYSSRVKGLVPGRTYQYQIVAHGTSNVSRDHLFFTVPKRAADIEDSNEPTYLAVWGDMGVVPLGFKVFDQILKDHELQPFNATMLFGDISYAGIDTEIKFLNVTKADEWEFVWDLFGKQIEPMSSKVPFMVGVGNHDMFYGAAAYSTRFGMPWEVSKGNSFWYSYDIGYIHMVSASSEHSFLPNSDQMKWLITDLEKARRNRKNVPWIVFNIHRPIYSSDLDGYSAHKPGCPLQLAFDHLLFQFKVDLVLVGHEHCYERIHPVVNGSVVTFPSKKDHEGNDIYENPPAPAHVVVGTAGALQEEKWVQPAPSWSAARYANGDSGKYTDTFGYGQLKVFNRTHLRFNFRPISGAIKDVFWLVKSSNGTA